jgi:hypothetical protein
MDLQPVTCTSTSFGVDRHGFIFSRTRGGLYGSPGRAEETDSTWPVGRPVIGGRPRRTQPLRISEHHVLHRLRNNDGARGSGALAPQRICRA